MQFQIMCFLITLGYASGIYGMESTNDKLKNNTHLVVIPGQNGIGGSNINCLFPQATNIHRVSTPQLLPDLGQNQCLQYLRKTMFPLIGKKDIDQIIIHASSQGTATALNYITEKQPTKVKLLILEAVLASGNSAISHTVENLMMPETTQLPLSYYWLPYLAKFTMPFYWPGGKQPILNIQRIPKDLPIIILHSRNDPQLSFEDAKALYAGLKNNDHKMVYLLPIEQRGHVNLLKNINQKESVAIHKILQHHELLSNQTSETNQDDDLSAYQPEPDITAYNKLVSKENTFFYIDSGFKAMFLAILIMCAYNYVIA